MPEPTWTDGEPDNLAAAAQDALEWLKWLARAQVVQDPDHAEKLRGCIAMVERHLAEATAK